MTGRLSSSVCVVMVLCIFCIVITYVYDAPQRFVWPLVTTTATTTAAAAATTTTTNHTTYDVLSIVNLTGEANETINPKDDVPPIIAITPEENEIQTKILQKLFFDSYWPESALPYLGADVWDELVDHNHSFYLRSYELPDGVLTELSIASVRAWVAEKPRPITIVTNNHLDLQWPREDRENSELDDLLAEPNLYRLYTANPYEKDISDKNSKVRPLPIGLQWNVLGTHTLYAEPKQHFHDVYSKVSKSPNETKALFLSPNRTNMLFVRSMSDSNHMSNSYARSNDALSTWRSQIYRILQRTAPKSTHIVFSRQDRKEYFDQLMVHRFCLSPAGNGLDCHGTWEALLAGCIPIAPVSSLVPMFDNLPVWFVSSWEEVTDDALEIKAKEILSKVDEYNFEKLFASWWQREINNVGW